MNEAQLGETQQRPPQLKLLTLIMGSGKSGELRDFFKERGVHLLYQFMGEGTANSEMLDVLGLGGSDNIMTICAAPGSVIRQLTEEAVKTFKMRVPGNGIAFTIPVSGVSQPIIRLMSDEFSVKLEERKSEIMKKNKSRIESEVENVKQEITHGLIVAVINPGYSDELMEAAKSAGAAGGTVIHARRVGNDEPVKFLGISVQPEKEIVAILAPRELKTDIMKAIGASCGITSEAQGLILSLPVDGVAGLDED